MVFSEGAEFCEDANSEGKKTTLSVILQNLTSARVCSIQPWACFYDHTRPLSQGRISERRKKHNKQASHRRLITSTLVCCNKSTHTSARTLSPPP